MSVSDKNLVKKLISKVILKQKEDPNRIFPKLGRKEEGGFLLSLLIEFY